MAGTLAYASRALLAAALALSGGALAAEAAAAADLPLKAPPPPPAVDWTGWHTGVNLGYGFAAGGEGTLSGFSSTFGLPAAVAAGFVPGNLGLRPQGVIGGGQAGYDWQFGDKLVGIETDLQGSAVRASSVVLFPGGGGFVPSTTTSQDALDWFGTLRARLGVLPLPRLLVYLTGGLAYGEVKDNFALVGMPAAAGDLVGASLTTRTGWTLGGGGEWAMTDRIFLRAEYLHVDLGTDTVRGADVTGIFPGLFVDYNVRLGYNVVRAAVDYKF
jgi:outer membrane immunogenic protein